MTLKRPESRVLFLVLAGILLLSDGGALADDESSATPIELAFWSPLQLFDESRSVKGLRLTLFWGVNQDVSGVDFSALTSKADGNVKGVQYSVLIAKSTGNLVGFQSAIASGVEGDCAGLQTGIFATFVDGHMRGAQLSVIGSGADKLSGVQVGVANTASTARGFQLGLFNMTTELKGVQLGLLNFNHEGFLPFFPIINFGL
jgi:hypothetical protein